MCLPVYVRAHFSLKHWAPPRYYRSFAFPEIQKEQKSRVDITRWTLPESTCSRRGEFALNARHAAPIRPVDHTVSPSKSLFRQFFCRRNLCPSHFADSLEFYSRNLCLESAASAETNSTPCCYRVSATTSENRWQVELFLDFLFILSLFRKGSGSWVLNYRNLEKRSKILVKLSVSALRLITLHLSIVNYK